MHIKLRHPSGLVKDCKAGFSWTTLFFGIFPALFRGDWKWALIMFICNIATCGFATIVFAFIYNKIYIKGLLEKNWEPASDADRDILIAKGILLG